MKKMVLIIGVLAIIISTYNTISEESIKSNLGGFIFGTGLVISYFNFNKLKKQEL